MVNAIRRFGRQNSGAAAVEYGLLVAVISISVIGASETMGISLTDLFDQIAVHLNVLGGEAVQN